MKMTPRASIPCDLDPVRVKQAREAAAHIAESLDLKEACAPFAAQAVTDTASLPGAELHMEDLSSIPFLDDVPGVHLYQHRARVRAQDADLVAAVCDAVPGYEDYCAALGLGAVEYLAAEPSEGPLAVAEACRHGAALDRLCARAMADGGLTVHPYMSNESTWRLAEDVARASRTPTRVLGPPPPVMWLANDKAQFARLVKEAVGERFLVATEIGMTAPALARHLLDFAGRFETVGLKRSRCASAMGNRVFDSQEILRGGKAGALSLVEIFLRDTKWCGTEEVLVVEWLQQARSPSTQLWIPPLGHGDPVVDGVYEQILEGTRGMFVGSRPSTLGRSADRSLVEPSLGVAFALQALGYVGRCSFDLLMTSDERPNPVRLSECNGRWGGTSTPMQLVDRLVAGPRPSYRAQDFVHSGLVGARFSEVHARLRPHLFDPQTQQGSFILYNVGPLEGSGKLDVIALGTDAAHADALMQETLPRALGL